MFSSYQKTLVLVLVFAFAHVPLPWLHKHEGLDAVSLAAHSASYHTGQALTQLPRSWHWHLLQAEAAFSPLAHNESRNNAHDRQQESPEGPVWWACSMFRLLQQWPSGARTTLQCQTQSFATASANDPSFNQKLCVWRL